MKVIDEKMISDIDIPDSGNFTANNNKYYVFFANPRCLRSKKAPVLLSLIIGFCISGWIFGLNFRMFFWTISMLLCAYYFYEDRFFYYYNKAAKQNFFKRYEKMMYFFNKVISSPIVYASNMPLSYYIFKIRDLLKKGDIECAEYLTDIAMNEYEPAMEIKYAKGVCQYLKGNTRKALRYWKEAVAYDTNENLKTEIYKLLKSN